MPPDPCPGSSDHHTSCGLSSCFQGLCATRFCRLFCPPRGHLGNLLTLSLTTLSVFLAARTMFGPIAGPGGTVFALLVLILFALIGEYQTVANLKFMSIFRWLPCQTIWRSAQPRFWCHCVSAAAPWHAGGGHPLEEHPLQLWPVWTSRVHRGWPQCLFRGLPTRSSPSRGSGIL